MKSMIVAVMLSLGSTAVLAEGGAAIEHAGAFGHAPGAAAQAGAIAGSNSHSAAGAISGSSADSHNLNAQQQAQQQQQATQQTAQQGNQQAITFNSPGTVEYKGGYEVKTVPNVVAPNIYPSANCHGSSSIGLSVLGFGASGGSTWVDQDCQMREYARMFHTFGQADSAIKLMCLQAALNPYAAALPACKPVPLPEPVVITKEVIKEVIKEVPVHDGHTGE